MSDFFPLNADAITISNIDYIIKKLDITVCVETGKRMYNKVVFIKS